MKYVAYYRVSTQKQGQSGLGLEAQQQSVAEFLEERPGELIGQYTEIETGTGTNALARRPELAAALKQCKQEGGTLVLAKLNRLSRNVHFVSGLLESGVQFVAADVPEANRLTILILAAVAEEESRRISERTKAALAIAKSRGVKLGVYGRVLAKQNRMAADQYARQLGPTVIRLRDQGYNTERTLMTEMNRARVPTPKGQRWHPVTVHRLLVRLRHLDMLPAAGAE
jgi:DNA invertase Pin-like site-specific DNA recombinase